MIINVKMTENDYLKFNEYYLEPSNAGKKTIRNIRVLFPAVLLCILIILIAVKADLTLIIIISSVFVSFSIIWQFIAPKIIKSGLKSNIKQIKKDGKLSYSENSTLEFNDEGITEATENSTLKVKYSDVISAGFAKDYIFIFFEAEKAFSIPRGCINKDIDLEGYLKSKIDNNKFIYA